MKLYKVSEPGTIYKEYRIIVATDRSSAIQKYAEIVNLHRIVVECEYICKRDEIIPTVEPKQEFKNQ